MMRDDGPATRGADLLCRALVDAGTDTIFALSGNQIMPVFDAAFDTPLRLIHTRHEAAATYAAEAHAQLTGRVGVALVTAGAGLANALAPLLTARASQTPILLLSGDSPVGGDGSGTFQEMDQVSLTQSLTKASRRLANAEEIPQVVAELLAIAQDGIPGPVHLALPDDVLRQSAEVAVIENSTTEGGDLDIAALLSDLAQAARPLILLGPHLSDTRCPGLASALHSATGAPALCLESPRGLRDPALGRWKSALADADLVVSLGKPVDFTQGFAKEAVAPQAQWHVITPDLVEADRARRNLGDCLTHLWDANPWRVAQQLAHSGVAPDNADWSTKVSAAVGMRSDLGRSGLTSRTLCEAVQRQIDGSDDPILVCDGGEFGQWAQAVCHAPRRVVNGVSGAIGGGIGYAMGARAAHPGAMILALMGDGTVGFHLSEFETAVRENLPFVVVIGNDQRWNAEHLIQTRDYGSERTHGCALSDARYDQAVAALGGFGVNVTRLDDLDAALADAIASGKPACVNVQIEGLAAPDA